MSVFDFSILTFMALEYTVPNWSTKTFPHIPMAFVGIIPCLMHPDFNIMELLFFWQDIYREKTVASLRNTRKLSVESQLPKVLDKKNTG
ncbi:MAG: hypothetical protein HY881_15345 [Deltaproteobacteria bacterium]|nr:hypothetical protein [Deltaproteobacteria bacterium]